MMIRDGDAVIMRISRSLVGTIIPEADAVPNAATLAQPVAWMWLHKPPPKGLCRRGIDAGRKPQGAGRRGLDAGGICRRGLDTGRTPKGAKPTA